MAMVSGGGSSRLNPDAPLFIPAAFRQVEDFSPEWWQLISTSTWYREYWLSQYQDGDGIFENSVNDVVEDDGGDIADLLPDSFDFDDGYEFDDFVSSYESEMGHLSSSLPTTNGLAKDAEALMKNLNLANKSPKSSPMEAAKYADKAAKYAPKYSPRRIQQPR